MQATTKRKLIYARYVLPLIALGLTFLLLFIPCYRYTTVDTGQIEAVSLWALMDNAWYSVCSNLFEGTGSQDNGTIAFSQTVLMMLIGFAVLFAVAVAVAVYNLVGACCYFRDPEDRGQGRILFVTLMPSRAVPLIAGTLVFPLLAFPHFLTACYESLLNYYVTLTLTFIDPLILAALLYGITLVISIATASTETGLGMNPYRRPVAEPEEDEMDEDDEY